MLITVALLPALFPERDGDGAQVLAGAVRDPAGDGEATALALEATASVTPTSAPPTTVAPTTTVTPTTAAPARVATPTTVAARAPTPTTTAAPTTTTTAPPRPVLEEPAPGATSQEGYATWYHGAGQGSCAHRSLPFGTVVTVTLASGAATQCTVGDRGPFVAGYVIDLSETEFTALAPLSTGRLSVTLTW